MQGSEQIIEVRRLTERQLKQDMLLQQVEKMCRRAVGKTYQKRDWKNKEPEIKPRKKTDAGWFYRIPTIQNLRPKRTDDGWLYRAPLRFTKETRRAYTQEVFDSQLADITRRLADAGKRKGWWVHGGNDPRPPNGTMTAIAPADQPEQAATADDIQVLTPEDWRPFFTHIFDRDAQIRVIYDTICKAKASDWSTRNHCLLYGLPACGKTDIVAAFAAMLGKEAVLKLNAPETSKAGAENTFKEIDPVPPILLIEELEKCNPANLSWLLGLLDQRGEIRKTVFRGSFHREARPICLATVNNMPLFESMLSGALASRFPNKIYCPRPSRAVLEKILHREVQKSGGRQEWIQPALDYCLEEEKTNDPRRAIAVLDGGDRLLTGEYQKDWLAIREAELSDKAKEADAGGADPPPASAEMTAGRDTVCRNGEAAIKPPC